MFRSTRRARGRKIEETLPTDEEEKTGLSAEVCSYTSHSRSSYAHVSCRVASCVRWCVCRLAAHTCRFLLQPVRERERERERDW